MAMMSESQSLSSRLIYIKGTLFEKS